MFDLQAENIHVHPPTQVEVLSDTDAPVSGERWWQQMLYCKAWCEQASGERFALYSDDLHVVSVWLVALAASGKTAVLAPNEQPATQTQLAHFCDGRLPAQLPQNGAQADQVVSFSRDQAICLFTSGSQGAPTLITRHWWQLLRETQTLAQQFSVWQEQTLDVIGTVSHQHIYGLLFRFFLPFYCGLSTQRYRQSFAEQLLQHLQQRAAILVSSPAHLRRFDDFAALAPVRASLRAVFSSGGALPAAVAARWQQHSATVISELFGSTETGGIAWRQQEHGEQHWQALPGVELQRAVDGQLSIRSKHLQPTEWVLTADRVKYLEGAQFMLAGRVDRIVKIEEKRLSLDAMEAACCAHPWVGECVALAMQNRATARQMVALAVVLNEAGRVELRKGKRVLNQALRTHLQHYFEAVLLPKRIRYLDQLPYTEQGKLPREKLHELLAS